MHVSPVNSFPGLVRGSPRAFNPRSSGHLLFKADMYADPALIRDKAIRVQLNENELAIVRAAARKLRLQMSTYCREAAMTKIRELITKHGLSIS